LGRDLINHNSIGSYLCREHADGYQGQVADEYAVLVKALWSGQYRSVVPKDFRVSSFFILKKPLIDNDSISHI
jgi:ubiquitin carboxyl-terminal hydrolase 8